MKERLTEKDYCGYDIANRKDFNGYDNEDDCEGIFACLQKLGQLEDIEEELGIDLITLIKFFKKEMVFKEKDGSEHHIYPLYYDGVYSLIRNENGWALRYGNENYYLKDFNKTFRFSTKTGFGRKMYQEVK